MGLWVPISLEGVGEKVVEHGVDRGERICLDSRVSSSWAEPAPQRLPRAGCREWTWVLLGPLGFWEQRGDTLSSQGEQAVGLPFCCLNFSSLLGYN